MNTTDSLLLIAIFFSIFVLLIWRLIIYSLNIGKYSPVKVSRSYEITAFQYFTKFDSLFIYYTGLFSLFVLSKVPDTFSPSVYLYDWRNPAILLTIGFLSLSLTFSYMYLDLMYWRHSKNVRITYYPEEKIITIDFPERTLTLRDGDIRHIEMISSGGKIQFGYSIYSLTNGDSFILTDRIPGTWAILEYFKRIPIKMTEKRFPVIK
jgi:hypothetical protein